MRTGRSLGNLADVAGSRTPEPTEHPDPDRITELERRVATVEGLLADVMQQLDRPYRDGHSKQNGHSQQNGTPKQAKPKRTPPKPAASPGDQPPPISAEQKQADKEAVHKFLKQHGDRKWQGKELRVAVKTHCNLSNKRTQLAIDALKKDGTLTVVNNVEVDGEMLTGAYQLVQS